MGLVPFHTWLADAHSQAPAPVSALMSGVLLSVAFSVILRIRPIIDAATGPGFLRTGLLTVGLATVLVAALLLTVTTDLKRMLAYSSMENMGLIAVAAAAGTQLAIAALLLHVLAHGVGKTVLFLAGGQLQAAHDSTAIDEITGVMGRSRLVGASFAIGIVVLLGLPPFAMFASELSIARSLAATRLVIGAGRRPAPDRRGIRRAGPQHRPAAVRDGGHRLATDRRTDDHRHRTRARDRRFDRPRRDRRPAYRLIPRRRRGAWGVLMDRDRMSRAVAADELGGATAELLAAGYRLALVGAHDDGDGLRVVYLFFAGNGRTAESSSHSRCPRTIQRSPRLRRCRFPPADSSAR